MKTLGDYIRELRDVRDLSLREFARQVHCSAAFISDIELGRRYPSDDVLLKMAHILKVDIQDLKAHDTRPPLEEIKRITNENPGYALAFRTVIDKNISPEQLMSLAKRKSRKRG